MSVKENYIPKKSTQQNQFIEKYPEYDGRGIKIAIIDTDIVDSSLVGLQKTTTNLPKLIYCGKRPKNNTVDTSKITKTFENNYINGLSGRKLKIPLNWKNPKNEWHIGIINFEKLLKLKMPGSEFLQFNKKINIDSIKRDEFVDCIVWFDGKKWRGCIDTSFSKNLENIKVFANFDDDHEVAVISNELIYCINIRNDGKLIEIFCPLHYHGTAVAEVAAGYFSENNPNSSGLAPGAQIVSLNWKNLEKALLKCIEMKVDIVNFSCSFSSSTYIKAKKIFKKMVEEYRIIITYYAGNNGPFYSTISEGISEIDEYIFLIGSIFTADVKSHFNYYYNNEYVNSVHNYSSKGPLPSGARGIDFVAPGAAIIDLPKWYQSESQGCHGTSLAAPNVAGSIACLLSALKANSILYSPEMIKMVLAKTAFLPKDANRLAYGNGIIKIMDAFEFIKKSINNIQTKCYMPFLLDKPGQKGIQHIQHDSYSNSLTKNEYTVKVDAEIKAEWILDCTVVTSKFVSHSKNIINNNEFNVKIDTSSLQEGSINYAEIYGIDSTNPSSIGPLFSLPITVIYPAAEFINKEIILKSSPPIHFFFKCPSESHQQCRIKIIITKINKERKIAVECFERKSSIYQKYELKFTVKRKLRIASFKIKSFKEPFELCFSHSHSSVLHLKLNIDFLKTNL